MTKKLILIWSQIATNLVWQPNFWSSMDLLNIPYRLQKCNIINFKCIREALRSIYMRTTSIFCQSALLWPSKSTRRSKRCAFFSARQHQINPYSFDLAECIDFSTRILLTYECEFMWNRSKQYGLFWIDAINSSSYFDIKTNFK